MADPQRPVISPPLKPSVTAPTTPTSPTSFDDIRAWFKQARRDLGSWDKKLVPLPVSGNRVTAYAEVLDYYVALGESIRATRAALADFVYIAGWGLDLTAFVDPPKSNPRQTIGEVLEAAAKRKVEVRVILPAQPQEGQAQSLAAVAKYGAGAILDPFMKLFGTHHQKFVVIRNGGGIYAFCGGCDIDNARLGRDGVPAGAKATSGAQESAGWHDVQLKIEGPAVVDIWNSFVQRFEEVATDYRHLTALAISIPIGRPKTVGITAYDPLMLREPDKPASALVRGGLDIQVVRTYPNKGKKLFGDQLVVPPKKPGYLFSPQGETGIYDLLVHALSQTKRTIYLEDQYLVNTMAMAGNASITDAIRRTIEKVSFQKMVILVAGTGTVRGELLQAGTRRADFIRQLGPTAASKVSAYTYGGDKNSPYWMHSKLWIFDDQFVVIGSANCNRRGYSHDSELDVGIADPDKRTDGKHFAHRLRMDLWLKHLNGVPATLASGTPPKVVDKDVVDFVAASALWDKAPLLRKEDFMVNAEADQPLTKALVEKRNPAAALIYSQYGNRERDWDIIDPNGA
jgi:phosphatidylserine/phosphatidylglycerophosphate/cardiolipin synthase-like enzyme